MRALLYANILVSNLVNPDSSRSAAAAILDSAEAGLFTAVVPAEALEETERIVVEKPWLAKRITPEAITLFVTALSRVAEIVPRLPVPVPRVSRDEGDDYLLAQAVLARVDVLVTRDNDLLSLNEVADVRILDPGAFLGLIRSADE